MIPRAKAAALFAAALEPKAEPRELSDPFPPTVIAINFRVTPQLRWKTSKRGGSMHLEQLWVSDDAKIQEWRIVPTV